MYALERGLHLKWLGVAFALLAMLASFGIGCGTDVYKRQLLACTTRRLPS